MPAQKKLGLFQAIEGKEQFEITEYWPRGEGVGRCERLTRELYRCTPRGPDRFEVVRDRDRLPNLIVEKVG